MAPWGIMKTLCVLKSYWENKKNKILYQILKKGCSISSGLFCPYFLAYKSRAFKSKGPILPDDYRDNINNSKSMFLQFFGIRFLGAKLCQIRSNGPTDFLPDL